VSIRTRLTRACSFKGFTLVDPGASDRQGRKTSEESMLDKFDAVWESFLILRCATSFHAEAKDRSGATLICAICAAMKIKVIKHTFCSENLRVNDFFGLISSVENVNIL